MATFRKSGFALAAIALAAMPACVMAADLATDGLVPVKLRNIDKAYQLPGANLAPYTSVLIKPSTVTFNKNWNARSYGSFGLKKEEVEHIRAEMAAIAEATFARVLSEGGYAIATAPGDNVLEVQADIVDLYVNAPDVRSDAMNRTYVRSAGDMGLQVTLRDSRSGATLLRTSDFKRGFETGRLEWANSVYNRMEAERSLSGWARQLKQSLDAAKAR